MNFMDYDVHMSKHGILYTQQCKYEVQPWKQIVTQSSSKPRKPNKPKVLLTITQQNLRGNRKNRKNREMSDRWGGWGQVTHPTPSVWHLSVFSVFSVSSKVLLCYDQQYFRFLRFFRFPRWFCRCFPVVGFTSACQSMYVKHYRILAASGEYVLNTLFAMFETHGLWWFKHIIY